MIHSLIRNPQFFIGMALVSASCFGLACGDDGGTGSTTDAAGVDGSAGDSTSTANVLCSLTGSGQQQLVYTQGIPGQAQTSIDESLDYNFTWACDTEARTLAANGVPNHAVTNGAFATKLSAQMVSQTFPISPAVTGSITDVREPGYALNGVKFDPATAGTCPDNATDDSDCNYAMGFDTWRMVATPGTTSPWKFNFGVDENDAHTQPTGAYHYHGTPLALIAQLNPNSATSMTLVGWAADGFPMYSVEGYADTNDASSAVVDIESSYQTVSTAGSGRPSIDDFPLGHFIQDWEYVEGSGDLDECNGRFGVTPEFPEGIYHYYLTKTYPFIQRCVKGTSTSTNTGGPPPR